ncbi:hypothetical protein COT97_02105 [Candidatus Falkowbacteria bacterium CG10_big_fil_rev_8_21_14_0_10_39_11]|uniref:histidine--tRNA ligase n=1 Tax=Candidatus Falkowbacteria bacterium CG10_big_fil_rev_8_21_14_0_10_39_11 TaxID=1974565 RepID=A0A2H0V5B2_9BACT|nr:MAG: hypothetical protein COT97_02105 [Candidatus Falkowbacteria bacterium CG10_big_fil_rev_8_21_14_0_10_39_11]
MPRRKKVDEPTEQIKKIKTPPLIKGMKDVLPSDNKYWRTLLDSLTRVAIDFNFQWVDTPLMEKYDLYAHTIGKNSDFVKKDLISFTDKNEKMVLRADYIPAVTRSFISHSLYNNTIPIKLWFGGSILTQGNFYESKHRQMYQMGYHVYGVESPAADVELVVMLYQTFVALGLNPYVRVNSLGGLTGRIEYAKALTGYIKSKRSAICTECRGQATRDPFKFLACANQKCTKQIEDAPQIVDYLSESEHSHLFKFLEAMDEVKVEYEMDNSMVHEFGYYNGTIYSIYNRTEDGDDVLLATGGRINYLSEMLGGPEMPACTISLLVEKVISEIKSKKVEIPRMKSPHVYLAQLSEQAKRRAMEFVEELRKEDFRVVANFSKDGLKSQLDTATKMGAKVILILGQKETIDGTILMRDVESGIQEVVNIKKVIGEVKKIIYKK